MKKTDKYLIVDAKNVDNRIYFILEDVVFFKNPYVLKDEYNLKEIFDETDLPEEFHKIVLKVNIPLGLNQYEAEECATGIGFDVTGNRIENIDGIKHIKCTCRKNEYGLNEPLMFEYIVRAKLDYKEHDEASKFYHDLSEKQFMGTYVKALEAFLNGKDYNDKEKNEGFQKVKK